MKLEEAVVEVVNSYVKDKKQFSCFDITKALRERANNKEFVLDDCVIINNNVPIYNIGHNRVKDIVKDVVKTIQDYEQKYESNGSNGSNGGYFYWIYVDKNIIDTNNNLFA